jgi:hypothetical protein
MADIISFGGGVNSTAMMLLMRDEGCEAECVIADHHCDWPETYEYLDYLEANGYPITRLDTGNLYDYYWDLQCIPIRQARWCTRKFKVEPLLAHCGQGVHYVGIDAGEAHRAIPSSYSGVEKLYPLVERGITRDGCEDIIRAHGLEVPPKSGCWFCPFARGSQVRDLWRKHPELVCKIQALEYRANGYALSKGKGPYYIYDKPIRNVVEMDQTDLFEDRTPCICGL